MGVHVGLKIRIKLKVHGQIAASVLAIYKVVSPFCNNYLFSTISILKKDQTLSQVFGNNFRKMANGQLLF